ncbi:MAG: hypothetical protein ACYC1C_07145 [Chloroflexota bacterium]
MVDPHWLECETCLNCRREGSERYCLALGRVLEEPILEECLDHRQVANLPPEVQEMLERRYSGLY